MEKVRLWSICAHCHTLRKCPKMRHNCAMPRFRQRVIGHQDGWDIVEQEPALEAPKPSQAAPTLHVRLPIPGEIYQSYLESFGVHSFTAREVTLLRRWGVVREPMRALWPSIVPALQLAQMLRDELGHPIVVGNGYRPEDYNTAVRGSRNSQHMHNRALDLDLPSTHAETKHREAFADAVGRLWHKHGDALKMGIGVYEKNPKRIHIDTGYRARFWEREHAWPILQRTKR